MKKTKSGFETSTQQEYTALSTTKARESKLDVSKGLFFIINPAAIMIIFSLLLASQRDRGGVSKSPESPINCSKARLPKTIVHF